jgi:hypothetical protein
LARHKFRANASAFDLFECVFSPMSGGFVTLRGVKNVRVFIVILLACAAGFSAGCSHFRRPPLKAKAVTKEDKLRKGPLLFVGTVKLVNEEDHFILIDSGGQASPAAEAVLKVKVDGVETAELKASDIRRRPFAIADIVSGTPKVGDRVYQQQP